MNNHEIHQRTRRTHAINRDLGVIKSNKLPSIELKKAQHRLENSSDYGVVYIENGQTPLITFNEPIEIRAREFAVAKRVLGLPEIVSEELKLENGRPDYAGWFLTPDRIPEENFAKIAEAIIWEMAEPSIISSVMRYSNGITRFAQALIRTVNAEPDAKIAAHKFARACYAFSAIAAKTHAGTECKIITYTAGYDTFTYSHSEWQELGGVMAGNPKVMDAISVQVERTGHLPSPEFMTNQVDQMRPVKVIA